MCGVGRPRSPEAPSAPRGLPLTSLSGSVLCAAPWEAAVDSEPSVSVPACGVTRSAKAPPPQVDVSSIAAAVTMSLHTSRICLGMRGPLAVTSVTPLVAGAGSLIRLERPGCPVSLTAPGASLPKLVLGRVEEDALPRRRRGRSSVRASG